MIEPGLFQYNPGNEVIYLELKLKVRGDSSIKLIYCSAPQRCIE